MGLFISVSLGVVEEGEELHGSLMKDDDDDDSGFDE